MFRIVFKVPLRGLSPTPPLLLVTPTRINTRLKVFANHCLRRRLFTIARLFRAVGIRGFGFGETTRTTDRDRVVDFERRSSTLYFTTFFH